MGWVDQAAGGTKGSGSDVGLWRRDGGLWRRRARLIFCAASWLTADSSQYSILSLNLSTPITLSQGRTQDFKLGGREISKFFFFQIRIHIVLINYQPRQILKYNHLPTKTKHTKHY